MDNANVLNYTKSITFNAKVNRTKTYKVKLINKWNEKNKIPIIDGISNLDFQSNMIIDQIKVLLDNMSFFKLHYLQGKDVKIK
jgi:nucleoside-triphosphatase THEP1